MEDTTKNDTIFLKKVKRGNIEAFEFFVKKYTPHIYKLCKAKVSVKEDAEDLTQNSFISLYKSIDRLDDNKPILPYLYMIARNELKMFYRRYKSSVSLNDEIGDSVSIEPHDEHQNQNITHILQNISSNQKTALQMVHEGFTYQEIADKLQKPINTVRTIIRRARLQLKDKINYEKKT